MVELVVIAILGIGLLATGAFALRVKGERERLTAEHERLESEHADLKARYDRLDTSHSTLLGGLGQLSPESLAKRWHTALSAALARAEELRRAAVETHYRTFERDAEARSRAATSNINFPDGLPPDREPDPGLMVMASLHDDTARRRIEEQMGHPPVEPCCAELFLRYAAGLPLEPDGHDIGRGLDVQMPPIAIPDEFRDILAAITDAVVAKTVERLGPELDRADAELAAKVEAFAVQRRAAARKSAFLAASPAVKWRITNLRGDHPDRACYGRLRERVDAEMRMAQWMKVALRDWSWFRGH